MNYCQQVLLVLMCTLFCRISAVSNLTFRVGDLSPSSCVESSGNSAAVCLNQVVTFTCITSGTNLLRWRTSVTGSTNVLFDNSPWLTQAHLENSMLGITFQADLQSTVGDVFTSTLSAIVDTNGYDGVSIRCDDVTGGNEATLPLQLVNTPPSPPLNLMAVSQADCSTNGVCGNASALVMWDCPANTGGTNVTSFNVSLNSNVNGITEYYIVSPTDLSITIDGLLLNANYTATVTASNCNGMSEVSTIIIFNSTTLLPPTGVTICSVDNSSIQIRWENPPGNEGLFCSVRQTRISWTVDDGTSSSEVAPPTATFRDILDAVQNAAYSVTVTYQTADGCEASSDISVVNDESLMDCPTTQPTPTPTSCTHEDLGVVDVTPDERCTGLQNSAQFTGGVLCYSGVTPGSVAAYVCNTTHHLEGSRFRRCQSNGNWSGSAPQCVEALPEIVCTTLGLGAGAVVGVSITIFLLSFTIGALLAAFICGLRWRGKSSGQPHTSPSEGLQTAPVYI